MTFTVPDKGFTHAGASMRTMCSRLRCRACATPTSASSGAFLCRRAMTALCSTLATARLTIMEKIPPVRECGVKYAAFGLLWRKLGPALVGEKEAKRFDDGFVKPLDEDDNTGCGNQLANLIAAYNPRWDEEKDEDACFEEAVAVAQDLLSHKLESIRAITRAEAEVRGALAKAKGGIVELKRFAPWKQYLIPSRAKFVVYPSQRGGYCAQGCPSALAPRRCVCPFRPSGLARQRQTCPAFPALKP